MRVKISATNQLICPSTVGVSSIFHLLSLFVSFSLRNTFTLHIYSHILLVVSVSVMIFLYGLAKAFCSVSVILNICAGDEVGYRACSGCP